MPTEREWRRIERDRADQQILRRAAAWLRQDPARGEYAGLSEYEDAMALAELLDVLATALPDIDSGVRWQAVESCRFCSASRWLHRRSGAPGADAEHAAAHNACRDQVRRRFAAPSAVSDQTPAARSAAISRTSSG